MQYVLDSSAIISNPEILSSASTHSLLIPQSVFLELLAIPSPDESALFRSLLNQATNAGAKIVTALNMPLQSPGTGSKIRQLSTPTDQEVAAIAVSTKTHEPVTVVTFDKNLVSVLAELGVACISPTALLRDIPIASRKQEIYAAASALKRTQIRNLVVGLVLGAIGALAFSFLIENAVALADLLQFWGSLIALTLLGMFLYWIRQRYRKTYGVAEFGVGLFIAYTFLETINHSGITVPQGIQLVGGMYVMVRGLDNVGTGLRGSRFARKWERLFGRMG